MTTDWQRALIVLSAVVTTAIVVTAMYLARSVLIPIVLAVFLAFVLAPVVTRIQRVGIGRVPAVITTVALVMLVSLGVGALVVHQVTQLAETIPDHRESIKEKVIVAKHWVVGDGTSRFGDMVDEIAGIIAPRRQEPQQTVVVEPSTSTFASQVDTYVSPAAEVLGQAALAFILTVFFLLNREDLRNRAIRLLGDGQVTVTTRAVDDASQRISRYLLNQLLLNTAFGLVIVIGLFLLGVNYAILWGVIAMLMRYVPYVGTWLGLIPPVIFSFATAPTWGGGWGQPIAVFLLFIGLELFCNNVMEPILYGKSMGISEVALLISAALWAFLWGPIGLILSGPLTVCLLVLGRHVARFRFLVVLLGDQPALHPRVAFYQRLAAHDQDEAEVIALEALKKSTPEGVFDEVIVPALCMARRDATVGELDAAELRFAVRAAREIAETVAERAAKPVQPSTGDERVRVLLCPARDEAEQVAAEILALQLDPARWEVKIAADDTLASELVALVTEFDPSVVVIGTLAPGGLSHARYLVARLRSRFPDVAILVGRWGCEEGHPDERNGSIRNTNGIDYSVAATRNRLAEILPVHTARQPSADNTGPTPEPVGTASA